MCTTAGWSGVLQALTNDRPPDCDPTLKSPSNRGDCGSMAIAIPFLVSYLIISSLVVVRDGTRANLVPPDRPTLVFR
jgi:hypothetical protein